MLTKFEVSNFKNFNEKISLDFTKSNMYGFNPECVIDGVINKALIYGHNGIGKSNLGFAIFDLISHLTDKTINKAVYKNYLNAQSEDKIAHFKYEFKLKNGVVCYEYGKSDIETLIYEEIHINNELYAVIDRRNNSIATFNAKGAENLQKDMGESKISIISYILKNAILKGNIENKCFNELNDFINGMLFFRSLEHNNYIGFEQGNKGISTDIIENNNVKHFQKFLNDAGIECVLGIIDNGNTQYLAFDFDGKLINFFDIASQGTKSLSLFYYWFQRLKSDDTKVTFLFIDEFDAFYHHSLSALIVKALGSVKAQVIMTTHNTSIITNELMRPDCYFLMSKKGIYSLANRTVKELRKAHNIEKMYKAGAFDA